MPTHRWVLPHLYPKQHAVFFGPERISACEASTKSGKAQPLSALVYTPFGPKRMGDIRVGDQVCTPTGTSVVTQIHPQGPRPIFRVTFADGSTAECTEDHLWEVFEDRRDYRRGFVEREKAGALTRARRKDRKGNPRVCSLSALMALSDGRRRRMWVRVADSVHYHARTCAVNPYLLGVLLSEGGLTTDTVRFTSSDAEVVERCVAALPEGHRIRTEAGIAHHITAGRSASKLAASGKTIASMVRGLGLMGLGSHEKFIPDAYRYNSEGIRWSVVRGIMDGDGYVDNLGQPCLEQTSPALAAHFAEVVESLGGSVITTIKQAGSYKDKSGNRVPCRRVYRQRVRHPDASMFFLLERKRSKCRKKRKTMGRRFRSIEYVRTDHAQCITLADPAGLYLTDRHVVTHNSVGALTWVLQGMLESHRANLWVSPVFPQAEVMHSRMVRMLTRSDPGGEEWESTKDPLRVRIKGGGSVTFMGSDNTDRIYGSDYARAVVDEASRVKEEAYTAVLSTLTKTMGQVRCIGNVKGRKNWFYRLCRKGEAGDSKIAYHKITAHDAIEARVITEQSVEDARTSGMPEAAFRELYFAEASDDGGNPFGLQHIEACVAPAVDLPVAIWGVDLAKSTDWTVAVGLAETGQWARFERWQAPWETTIRRLEATIGDCRAIVDSTGVGDPVVESLQRVLPTVEGFKFSSQSKQRIMEGLAVAIQSRRTTLADGVWRQEMESFEYEYTRTGVRYAAMEGLHDDCVCGHALAVSGILNPQEQATVEVVFAQPSAPEDDFW